MPDYIVTNATIKRDNIEGKYGVMRDITLTLVPEGGVVPGDQFTASWYTKATTEPPVQGTVLTGDVTDGEYGKKFKKAQAAGGFGGGGPRPEDPKRSAAIQRMHAQKVAVMVLQAKATAGLATADDFTPAKLASLADWFYGDADKARSAA